MRPTESQLAALRPLLDAVLPLPDSAWDAARPRFTVRRFAAGAHLFEAGTVVRELFFLTAGLVRLYYRDLEGKEFNKSFSRGGQVLSSLSSLVEAHAAPFSVQALLPTEALLLPYDDFLALAAAHAEWNALRIRLLEQLVIRKERREAEFLLLTAEQRYENFLREFAHIAPVIPNYHIAAFLGITEVALSRIRRRMGLTRVNAAPKR